MDLLDEAVSRSVRQPRIATAGTGWGGPRLTSGRKAMHGPAVADELALVHRAAGQFGARLRHDVARVLVEVSQGFGAPVVCVDARLD